tara:strand:- start:7204 stop:7482 length:279 start_codon:yes stop_codon:yes gene_type:complete
VKINLHGRLTKFIFAAIEFIMGKDTVELNMAQWKGIEKMQDLIFDLQTSLERLSTDPVDKSVAEKYSRRYQKILDQLHPERQEWKKNDTLDI